MVHPKDAATHRFLFNMRKQLRIFTPPSQWEEAGLNKEIEFIAP